MFGPLKGRCGEEETDLETYVVTSGTIFRSTCLKLYKIIVKPVVKYGSRMWSLDDRDNRAIEVVEINVYTQLDNKK
jgi:hypothetical protein